MDMNVIWSFFNSNFFNVIVARLGWWIVSWLRDKQAIKERRRETNVGYIIDAYRVLSGWVHNKNLTKEEKSR